MVLDSFVAIKRLWLGIMMAVVQARAEATMMRNSVTFVSYAKGCFIATYRSALIKTKWWNEASKHFSVTIFDTSVIVQNMLCSPLRRKLSMAIWRGWRTSPITRSVVAKQASAMLDLVRSRRLVFTDTITRMLSKMMRGQMRAFTVILTVKTLSTSCEIFAGLRGKVEKPQLDTVMLDVVSFIFVNVRFWLVKTSSLWDGFLAFALCHLDGFNRLFGGL